MDMVKSVFVTHASNHIFEWPNLDTYFGRNMRTRKDSIGIKIEDI